MHNGKSISQGKGFALSEPSADNNRNRYTNDHDILQFIGVFYRKAEKP